MEEDAVVGVTSNPTIFQKALAEGDWYDEQLAEVLKSEDDPTEIFLALAMDDIRDACDLLRPVWDDGEGMDGWVSLEVDPTLAYEREAHVRAGDPVPRGGRPAEPATSRSRRRSPASARSRTASRRASRST